MRTMLATEAASTIVTEAASTVSKKQLPHLCKRLGGTAALATEAAQH